MTDRLQPPEAGARPTPAVIADGGASVADGDGSDIILSRLLNLHPKLIDLSLDRMWRILADTGHPERSLPPVVHVAGTNGKGSTIAFLRAMLEAAGYRVHAYISPHLVRFHERVTLAGRPIAEDLLIERLRECESANAGRPITWFEITTAAAFLAFAREPADILLLETGLGGRLDATNTVPRPVLSAITPVSGDHHHFLGETVADIAAEKAGILRPDVPAILGPQPGDALAVIRRRAAAIGAPLWQAERDWSVRRSGNGLVWSDDRATLNLPPPVLCGPHQADNAGLAIACARRLDGFDIPQAALARGLATANWPGRLQRLVRGPLVDLLAAGQELWLDGGHNPGAGAALALHAQGAWSDGRPLGLVFGMLDSKTPESFLAPLAPFVADARAVPVPDQPASLTAAAASEAATAAGLASHAAPDPITAVGELVTSLGPGARILICGSLYLVGSILRTNS